MQPRPPEYDPPVPAGWTPPPVPPLPPLRRPPATGRANPDSPPGARAYPPPPGRTTPPLTPAPKPAPSVGRATPPEPLVPTVVPVPGPEPAPGDPVSTGRAAPPPTSRIVPPLQPPVEEPATTRRRSIGKVLGTVATTVLVLAMLGVVFKIIVRPVPAQTPAPAAAASDQASSAPVPTPNGSTSSGGPSTSAAPVQASGVPMPRGDIPGWHQTFAEDFTAPLGNRWRLYTGQPGGDPGGYFDSSHVSTANGILTIGAWKANSPNGYLYVSGGMSNAPVFSQTYGLYQVRFKMDKGYGISYTLQLWPTSNQWPPEIDILEDSGKNRTMTSATLHYGAANTQVHREINGNWTGWHTAEVEWEPGSLTYRIDGNVWTTITGSFVPSTPMSIAIQSQAWRCGHVWEGCPNATTPAKVNLQVDWVVAYQKTGA